MTPASEVDDLPLMGTKDRVQIALRQQRQMSIGAEPSISQHDVAGLQLPGDRRGLGHLVSPQRGRGRPEQHPGGEVEERQPLGHGEAAALLLATGLAEVTLQLGHVGHREARPVNDPDPVPEPSRTGRVGGSEGGGGRLQERVVDGQWEPFASLTVGAVGEGPDAEMDDMANGGVAVEDLEQEEIDGGRGVEDASPPRVAGLTAGRFDGFSGQAGGDVLAQSVEDGDDTRRHGRTPFGNGVGRNQPPSCPEFLPCSRCDKAISGQGLRFNFAAFLIGFVFLERVGRGLWIRLDPTRRVSRWVRLGRNR